jgi:MFS transporter, DHA3 family, tetracycline resistance protein
VLVGTMLESVAFLAEAPTGLVADVYSRRLSIIIGLFLTGAGFLLEGGVPPFAAILASQVLWGIGSTFTSGATAAWLADEVGERAAASIYLRASRVGQVGALTGTFASVALASVRLNLPIVMGSGAFIGLAVFLALLMPEDGFRPAPATERNSFQKMGYTFSAGTAIIRASPVLLTILGTIIFRGAASEAFDRLWQPHFVQDLAIPPLGQFKPIVWFGVISAAVSLLSLGATECVRRRPLAAHAQHGAGDRGRRRWAGDELPARGTGLFGRHHLSYDRRPDLHCLDQSKPGAAQPGDGPLDRLAN